MVQGELGSGDVNGAGLTMSGTGALKSILCRLHKILMNWTALLPSTLICS